MFTYSNPEEIIDSNLVRAFYSRPSPEKSCSNEEQDRLEKKWLTHPALGELITQTFYWGYQYENAMQREMKTFSSHTYHMGDQERELLRANELPTRERFVHHADQVTENLTKLLNELIKIDTALFTSDDLLSLLNLQLKHDDGDLIEGTKLIAWLNHPLCAELFLNVLQTFNLDINVQIKLLAQCITEYYCKDRIKKLYPDTDNNSNLSYLYSFAQLTASPVIQAKLFELLEKQNIEPNSLSDVVTEENSSASPSSSDKITLSQDLIKAYDSYVTNKKTALKKPKPINIIEHAKKHYSTTDISTREVRSYLWLLKRVSDSISILQAALKNPKTDPFAVFMSKAGNNYFDRLILDYMFALEAEKNSMAMCSYANKFKLDCLRNHYSTFAYIMRDRNEVSDIAKLDKNRSKIKDKILTWPLAIRAITLDAATDLTTPLGIGMATEIKENFWSLPTKQPYEKVCRPAATAKQEIISEFLKHTHGNADFDEIRDQLTPSSIIHESMFRSTDDKQKGYQMTVITKKAAV